MSRGVNVFNMCSKKVTFRNKRKAQARAKKHKLRSYQCPVCGKWHLTSKGVE